MKATQEVITPGETGKCSVTLPGEAVGRAGSKAKDKVIAGLTEKQKQVFLDAEQAREYLYGKEREKDRRKRGITEKRAKTLTSSVVDGDQELTCEYNTLLLGT